MNATGDEVDSTICIIAGYDNDELVYVQTTNLKLVNGEFETEINELSFDGISKIKMFAWDTNIKPTSINLEYEVK